MIEWLMFSVCAGVCLLSVVIWLDLLFLDPAAQYISNRRTWLYRLLRNPTFDFIANTFMMALSLAALVAVLGWIDKVVS